MRTVRSHVVIVIIAVAFPVVLTALIVALTKEYDIGADLLTGSTTGASVLSALLIGSIGVLAFAQEHTFGTLRVSFAATPVRRRVMVAKTIVLGALGALIAVVIAAVTTARSRHPR